MSVRIADIQTQDLQNWKWAFWPLQRDFVLNFYRKFRVVIWKEKRTVFNVRFAPQRLLV